MPTKLNSAGKQQNYVPAGNGDASGEYGDNATGSNKHFTNFKKDIDIEVSPNEEKSKIITKSFEEYINENFKTDFGKELKTSFDAGNEEQRDKLNYFVSNGFIKISQIKSGAYYNGSVALSSMKGNYGKEYGDTLYHEFGHAYDEYFAKGWVDEKGNTIFKGLITDEDYKKLYENYKLVDSWYLKGNLSTNKYLSNGKTLYETIQEECHKMVKEKTWDKIIEEYNNSVKTELTQKYPDYTNVRKQYDEIRNKIYDEANKEFPTKWVMDEEKMEHDANSKARNEYIKRKFEEFKVDELRKKKDEINLAELKINNKVLKKYSNLSDMYGIYKKIPYGFGSGHSGSYGKRKGAIAHEFFAEFNSASARSDEYAKAQMELYEKYMPESTKMAKELFSLMDNAWKGFKR